MKVEIIKIGNSQGIRIPKTVLRELGSAGPLDMRVEGGCLILEPVSDPRKGWD